MALTNFWKGGDFVVENEISRMISEGCPNVITPPVIKNSRFPERKGRSRFDTALDLATTDSKRPERPDWSLFNAAREMDDVSGREVVGI